MAGLRQKFLDRLYTAYPVFADDKPWMRVLACVALCAAIFTVLYLIGIGLLLLGLASLSTHPGWLHFFALLPGLLVLVDKKARLLEYAAFMLGSWLAITLLGVVFVMLIWMIGA